LHLKAPIFFFTFYNWHSQFINNQLFKSKTHVILTNV